MKHLFTSLFILLTGTATAQTAQQLRGILGNDVSELPPQKSYPYSSFDNRCTIAPSQTLANDTSGVHLQNEYLLFRSAIHYRNGSERLKFIHTDYVTVAEYQAFQQDVRDSVAREQLYQNNYDEEEALEWLRYDKNNIVRSGEGRIDREKNRRLYPLNHDRKVEYDDDWTAIVLLADLYLPFNERFNHQKAFDDRKLVYVYTDIYEQLNGLPREQLERIDPDLRNHQLVEGKAERRLTLISDPYAWGGASASRRDQWAVLGELYEQLEPNSPAIGLTGAQAAAFCHWKQEQLQQAYDRKGMKCTIVVTLPTLEDQQSLHIPDPAFAIPERDYTQQWRITAGEYKRFVAHVRDSLLRETLYATVQEDARAQRLLLYELQHFDGTEIIDFDAADRANNRSFFPLNYRTKINRRDYETRTIVDSLQQTPAYRQPGFTYTWMDVRARSVNGKLKTYSDYYRNRLVSEGVDKNGEPIGKDLDLDWTGQLHYASGVRSHQNLARFYHRETLPVLPDAASSLGQQDEKALVQGISYEQALAFYHWKYPTWKDVKDQHWQAFVLPTAEQFTRIQRGETIVVPAQSVPYPTPLFRYVVHVY